MGEGADVGVVVVWFEDFQSAQLLVKELKRLEFASFDHLLLEPCFGFVLLNFFEVRVIVIDVSVLAPAHSVRAGIARKRRGEGEGSTDRFSCSNVTYIHTAVSASSLRSSREIDR